MSDDELPDPEERAEGDDNSASPADAAQAVRMGNSFEFTRAVLPSAPRPAWLAWMGRLAARAFLPVTAVLWLGMVVCVLGRWVLPGLLLAALAAFFDREASREYVRETLLLRRLGVVPHVRLAIRTILVIALLAGAGWGPVAVGVAAVSLSLMLVEVIQWAATAWLATRQPALVYRVEGPQPEASVAYARAYRKSSFTATETVTIEILMLLAAATMVLGLVSGRYAVLLWAVPLILVALGFTA